MNSIEARNIAVVLKYFDGCNSGDLDALLSTLHPDVVHYFLPEHLRPIRGAEHLARYARAHLGPDAPADDIAACAAFCTRSERPTHPLGQAPGHLRSQHDRRWR